MPLQQNALHNVQDSKLTRLANLLDIVALIGYVSTHHLFWTVRLQLAMITMGKMRKA